MAPLKTRPVNYDSDKKGWIMVGVAFFSSFIILGNLKALGVILLPITNDFNSDLWLVGWIAVLYNTMQNCLGPIVGAISRLVGNRPAMVIGGLLASVGFILASISSGVFPMAVFIVGLSGAGASLSYFISFAVMASFFKENYPLAIGIASMGIPFSMIVYGPVTQVLLDTYGWRGATLLLGAITLHLVPCGMMVQRDISSSSPNADQYREVSVRDEDETSTENEGRVFTGDRIDTDSDTNQYQRESRCMRLITALDFALLTNVRFILLIAGRCALQFTYSGWIVYMVSHGKFQGLSQAQASFLPTMFGVGNIIGKVVGPLLQWIHVKPSMTIWACFGVALVFGAFIADALTKPFIGQLAVTCLIGMSFGISYQAIDVMVRFLSTDDRIVSILGWQAVFGGVSGIAGGLLSGWIYEWTGSFSISFFVYGGVILLSLPMFIIDGVYSKREAL